MAKPSFRSQSRFATQDSPEDTIHTCLITPLSGSFARRSGTAQGREVIERRISLPSKMKSSQLGLATSSPSFRVAGTVNVAIGLLEKNLHDFIEFWYPGGVACLPCALLFCR